MQEFDQEIADAAASDDETLLLEQVVCAEADLLYLDSYLSEILRKE